MRKLLLYIFLVFAATLSQAYKPLPAELAGSMMPLDFAGVERAEWPDSLRPVGCVYVARHGSRYMSGEKKFKTLRRELEKAREQGNLSAKGFEALAMIDSVQALSRGRWGELSAVGAAEERQLGAQMLLDYPTLAGGAGKVSTVSAFVPRAMMTMYDFNHALMLGNDSLEVRAASGRRFSPLLYFFATDSAYADWRDHGQWRRVTDRLAGRLDLTPARNLFRSTKGMDTKLLSCLCQELYSVLQSRQAMGLSAPNDRLMSAEQYRQCWSLSNLTHYLRNGVTPMNSSCLRAVTPLIERIIADADSLTASSGSEPTLIGYFGHAETLLPLLSALQIPGCSYMPKGEADSPETYADLHKHWQLQQITPLGANFALFLLKSESGRTYAALRLNGHPVVLPGGCEIIPWQSLAARWRSLMAK